MKRKSQTCFAVVDTKDGHILSWTLKGWAAGCRITAGAAFRKDDPPEGWHEAMKHRWRVKKIELRVVD